MLENVFKMFKKKEKSFKKLNVQMEKKLNQYNSYPPNMPLLAYPIPLDNNKRMDPTSGAQVMEASMLP